MKNHKIDPVTKILDRSSHTAINGPPSDTYVYDNPNPLESGTFDDIPPEKIKDVPDKIIKLAKKVMESPRVEISIQGENITITTYKR